MERPETIQRRGQPVQLDRDAIVVDVRRGKVLAHRAEDGHSLDVSERLEALDG